MMMGRGVLRLVLAVGLLVVGLLGTAVVGVRAADLGVYRDVPSEGLDCEAPAVKTFDAVWLGHFSGGFSHRLGPGLPVVLDWRDEKLCFPTRRSCDRYMSVMRREFHRPEGYFTCLPIR